MIGQDDDVQFETATLEWTPALPPSPAAHSNALVKASLKTLEKTVRHATVGFVLPLVPLLFGMLSMRILEKSAVHDPREAVVVIELYFVPPTGRLLLKRK